MSVRCEVVAVGTELLLGQIVDTNSAWIGEQLALAGIDSHFQTKVGDNQRRIVLALRTALARSDAVIVCGGVRPAPGRTTPRGLAARENDGPRPRPTTGAPHPPPLRPPGRGRAAPNQPAAGQPTRPHAL